MPSIKGNPYYARLNEPTEEVKRGRMVFKPAFSVQLGLNKEAEKKAEELGLKIYDSNDSIPQKHLKFTSYVSSDEHKEFSNVEGGRRPVVYDKKGKELPRFPIADPSSEISVIFSVNDYDGSKKAIMRAVQLFNIVTPEGYEEGSESSVVQDVDLDKDLVIETDDDDVEVDEDLNDSLDDV